jgi:flagellar hook protein FlgE
MDVIGNNIANVNTIGFKSSRVVFQDIYSQTIKPASTSGGASGGTNPQQIGLGVQVATIDVMHTKGTPQYTGYAMDLSIDGDGYFTISDGAEMTYTRAGNLYLDSSNYLVDANGNYVMCVPPAVTGTTYTPAQLQRLLIPTTYTDVSINKDGQVVGLDATNTSVVIGTIAVAKFANPNGLEKSGENSYRTTVNSGTPAYVKPATNGSGKLNPGTLEMANIDLTAEFADMIVTQRGFQANSRIITTTDEMLEELVNMVR